MAKTQPRIIIIGGGAAGCGAAWALHKAGYKNWALYEASHQLGGLSGSFRDNAGFLWDYGGHAIFGRQSVFFEFLREMLHGQLIFHKRENFAWVRGRRIPFPVECGLYALPPEMAAECLTHMAVTQDRIARLGGLPPRTFGQLIEETFGEAFCSIYMRPYNEKLWGVPLDAMDVDWILERVPRTAASDAIMAAIQRKAKTNWGPNQAFAYPKVGGSGAPYAAFQQLDTVSPHLLCGRRAVVAGPGMLRCSSGEDDVFDALIHTGPLDALPAVMPFLDADALEHCGHLRRTNVAVVGLGIARPTPTDWHWVYYPDGDIAFFRAVNFSRFAPDLVPDGKATTYSSMLFEMSYTDQDTLPYDPVERTIEDAQRLGVLPATGREWLLSSVVTHIAPAYPVPMVGYRGHVANIAKELATHGIYSVGRFGSWDYQHGNMDHAFLAGYSAAQAILSEQ